MLYSNFNFKRRVFAKDTTCIDTDEVKGAEYDSPSPRHFRMALSLRRRSLSRLLALVAAIFLIRLLFSPSETSSRTSSSLEIEQHNFIERATRPDKTLNVQRHKFLQARMGRDERTDLLSHVVRNGVNDYWERFQMP